MSLLLGGGAPRTSVSVAPGAGLIVAILSLCLAASAWAQPAPASQPAQPAEPAPAPTPAASESAEQAEEQARREAEAAEVARAQELEQQVRDFDQRREQLEQELAQSRQRLDEIDRRVEEAVAEQEEAAEDEIRRIQEQLERLEEDRDRWVEERETERERREDDWRREARLRRNADPKIAFGTTVKVRSGEIAEDVVSIAGGAKIDGEVLGDVATFGGPAKIDGRVGGSVTAFGAEVELGPRAVVDGDVTSVGSEVRSHPGARVGGEINGGDGIDWDIGRLDWFEGSRRIERAFGWADWIEFFWALLFTGFLIVLCAFLFLVLRRPLERVRDTAVDSAAKSLLIGFLILALTIPGLVTVIIVLAISIIGIPFLLILLLALPFLLIALLAAMLYGFAAISLAVGSVLRGQLKLGMTSSLMMIAVGVFALRTMTLSGDLLDAIGLPGFITVLFGFAGFVIQLGALCTGLGAVVLSRFGLASSASGAAPPPDLPPLPQPETETEEWAEEYAESWDDDPAEGRRDD